MSTQNVLVARISRILNAADVGLSRILCVFKGYIIYSGIYKVVPPSDVCWFINPINYRYIYHEP